jgi:hypothetical protein
VPANLPDDSIIIKGSLFANLIPPPSEFVHVHGKLGSRIPQRTHMVGLRFASSAGSPILTPQARPINFADLPDTLLSSIEGSISIDPAT